MIDLSQAEFGNIFSGNHVARARDAFVRINSYSAKRKDGGLRTPQVQVTIYPEALDAMRWRIGDRLKVAYMDGYLVMCLSNDEHSGYKLSPTSKKSPSGILQFSTDNEFLSNVKAKPYKKNEAVIQDAMLGIPLEQKSE